MRRIHSDFEVLAGFVHQLHVVADLRGVKVNQE